MYSTIKHYPLGDNSILIEFNNEISEEVNVKVQEIVNYIENNRFEGVIEVVPAYTTLQIIYNPLIISYNNIISCIINGLNSLKSGQNLSLVSEIITIPVLYGGEFGLDMDFVASHNNLTQEEVITIHSSAVYRIYMMGFMPGFPYLGGMSDKISTPRLESPRTKIPGGSVGIAGNQTGVYPLDSPGGWRIIGRTPIKLFDKDKEQPVMLKAGQFIRFTPINEKQYFEILKGVENNQYFPQIVRLSKGADSFGKVKDS